MLSRAWIGSGHPNPVTVTALAVEASGACAGRTVLNDWGNGAFDARRRLLAVPSARPARQVAGMASRAFSFHDIPTHVAMIR